MTCRGELKFLTSIFKLNRLTVILSIAISLICIILFRTDSTNIAKTYLKLFDFNYDLQFFAGKLPRQSVMQGKLDACNSHQTFAASVKKLSLVSTRKTIFTSDLWSI